MEPKRSISSHYDVIADVLHVHGFVNDLTCRLGLAEFYNIFDMAKSIFRERHAFVLEGLHEKSEAIEVGNFSTWDVECERVPVLLVNVWEQAEEGGVEGHSVSDLVSEVIVSEHALAAIVSSH